MSTAMVPKNKILFEVIQNVCILYNTQSVVDVDSIPITYKENEDEDEDEDDEDDALPSRQQLKAPPSTRQPLNVSTRQLSNVSTRQPSTRQPSTRQLSNVSTRQQQPSILLSETLQNDDTRDIKLNDYAKPPERTWSEWRKTLLLPVIFPTIWNTLSQKALSRKALYREASNGGSKNTTSKRRQPVR